MRYKAAKVLSLFTLLGCLSIPCVCRAGDPSKDEAADSDSEHAARIKELQQSVKIAQMEYANALLKLQQAYYLAMLPGGDLTVVLQAQQEVIDTGLRVTSLLGELENAEKQQNQDSDSGSEKGTKSGSVPMMVPAMAPSYVIPAGGSSPAAPRKDTSYCYSNRTMCNSGCDAPSYGMAKDYNAINACRQDCEAIYNRCVGQ